MSITISGSTRVAAVIGDPVTQSRSPQIHNAAYAALGLDWVYVALPVPEGRAGDAVRALAALGIAGINVTMPHKAGAAGACDALTPAAQALGVVNTVVVRSDGSTLGDSTDGPGFLTSLADAGVEPTGAEVVVLGAGGAARAVVHALGEAGASVTVAARRSEAARDVAALAPGAAAVELTAGFDVGAFAGVVQATPAGMAGRAALALSGLRAGQWVADLVYEPVRTPLLDAAAAAGARTVDGLGMLVHQAALSFEAFTGIPAPRAVAPMREAVGETG